MVNTQYFQHQHTEVPQFPSAYQSGSNGARLKLEDMLMFEENVAGDAPPQLGSAELPTIGSLGHYMRRCKPCAFVTKTGCANGTQCPFCHLCEEGEKKRRRKEKKALISAARRLGNLQAPRDHDYGDAPAAPTPTWRGRWGGPAVTGNLSA